jgi:hypothetical protein
MLAPDLNVQALTEIAAEGFKYESGPALAAILAGFPDFLEALANGVTGLAGQMQDHASAAPCSDQVDQIAQYLRVAEQAARTAYQEFHAANRLWLDCA